MKKLLFLFLFCAVFPPPLSADTVYLKNGQQVTGQIVERTPTQVTIMVGNVPQRYYVSQIERVEKDEPAVVSDAPAIDVSDVEGVEEAKAQLILQFFKVNGTYENLKQTFEKIVSQSPAERQEELRAVFNVEEIIKQLIPIYNKYFTEDELKTIIDFYQSPAGVKMLQTTPELLKEVVQTTVKYLKEKANL